MFYFSTELEKDELDKIQRDSRTRNDEQRLTNSEKISHRLAGAFGVKFSKIHVVVSCGVGSQSLPGSPLTVNVELYLDELSNVYFRRLANVPSASLNSCWSFDKRAGVEGYPLYVPRL